MFSVQPRGTRWNWEEKSSSDFAPQEKKPAEPQAPQMHFDTAATVTTFCRQTNPKASRQRTAPSLPASIHSYRCVVVDGNPSIEKIPRRNGKQTGRERRNLLTFFLLTAFLP